MTPGRRLVPSRTDKSDKEAQLRVDAGEKVDGRQKIVLQVNSDATSEALKKWVNKQPQKYHAKLATASFDTQAEDQAAEAERVLQELEDEATSKVG